MTGSTSLITGLLLGVLAFGITIAAGQAPSEAAFRDDQTATGSVSAVDDFGDSGPIADAGGPYSVTEGDSIQLDGSDSSTSKGTIKDYSWQILSGPGTLSGTDSVDPTYDAPGNVDSDTQITVELTVTDNKGNSDTDTAMITVRDAGAADAPSVDGLAVTTTGNKNRKLDITADVSDPTTDGDSLKNVTVEVVNTKKSRLVYTNTITVPNNRDSAAITDSTGQLKNKQESRVVVTVFDTDGDDSGSASKTRTTG